MRRHYGVRTERYKLIYFYEPESTSGSCTTWRKIPQEMQSVYADPAYQDVVREMKAELQTLRDKYQDDGSVVQFPKSDAAARRHARNEPRRVDEATELGLSPQMGSVAVSTCRRHVGVGMHRGCGQTRDDMRWPKGD